MVSQQSESFCDLFNLTTICLVDNTMQIPFHDILFFGLLLFFNCFSIQLLLCFNQTNKNLGFNGECSLFYNYTNSSFKLKKK